MSLVNFIQHPFLDTGECISHITCALDMVPYGHPNLFITELFQYLIMIITSLFSAFFLVIAMTVCWIFQ